MTGNGNKIGAVAVVGGGIAGVQSALDLADMGFKVYLIEKTPAIGGIMAMLDKTFPTNDCSMCILSPKLVDCSRHQNIEIMTYSEVKSIEGEAGNFSVTVHKKPRYVDIEKCTSCNDCVDVCPISMPNEFEKGLSERKAIYKYYPQAIPNAYVIDKEGDDEHRACINCMMCVKACKVGAIDHDQVPEDIELNVGAVILSMGAQPFDPSVKKELGYGRYPNVITSMEFERILSASGPYQGKILRPGDMKEPRKIAWIQCVGSRDWQVDREYCSSMCCMYTAKEAVIAKEHNPEIEPTIFYIDIRSFGKDFDKYVDRAKNVHGIKYVRSKISEILEDKGSKDLILRYEDEAGELHEERFDMVVLSIGLGMTEGKKETMQKLGVEVNDFGFAYSNQENPVALVKPGIFMAGSFLEPQAIPESVMQASAAAAQVGALLREARGTLATPRPVYKERDISGEEPRIGVFLCHCGTNIGGKVDIPSVVEHTKSLDNVVFADENIYTCSEDTQKRIVDAIKEHGLNRVIVAACTPRTHEPLFKKSLAEAGLNPHLLEMTNIREHCSWVHEDGEQATWKAKELIAMTVAKSRHLEPIPTSTVEVTQKAMVIGGGVGGMTTALSLAGQGFDTMLVERKEALGGRLNDIRFTVEGIDVPKLLSNLKSKLEGEEKVTVLTGSKVTSISGYVGNYEAKIDTPDGEVEYTHGVVVITVGADEHIPSSYGYGTDERVVTQSQIEDYLAEAKPEEIALGETFVFIQCVESREGERNYCSRVCCMGAIKNALRIKELNPRAEVFVLYRDLMTYGFWERFYKQARGLGIVFMQYDVGRKPEVEFGEKVSVKVWEPLLQEEVELEADHLVLSSGMAADPNHDELAKMLKVPLNEDGFFLEAHVKLRPVDFSTRGVFLAGCCHGPKFIGETIYQAQAAAARAATLLANPSLEAEPNIAVVDVDMCSGCKTCISLCPYNAIVSVTEEIDGVEVTHADINEGLCQGCGTCVAACPSGAIDQRGFKDDQILAMIRALGACVPGGGE
ncbi:MAG: CoB--CoM heterodisulfide reductase iron-sulfur subunit A family protein [Thermoplasmata archaeon]|nr:CoB--CoM heterodisulfide reductase iron-sulfur subunit A family protein [Thermoplasmata archaeon]